MRVINGSAGGIQLKTPEGLHTRPTTDRAKEALFSAIQFEIEGRTVLDLFGGSGQLGIEALSRGAASALFTDNDRNAVRIIRENLAKTGFSGKAAVLQTDALRYLAGCRQKFDLIFLDPPYHDDLLLKSMELIEKFDILGQNGIIVTERESGTALDPDTKYYVRGRDYGFGAAKITVFKKNSERNTEL